MRPPLQPLSEQALSQAEAQPSSQRIAVIGAGISGLVAAYLLHNHHQVTIFEASDRLGGHTDTHLIEIGSQSWNVDTGFIVFNDRNYPHFEALLERLEVQSQPSNMSFSVSDGADFEYASTSLNGVFARRAHLVDPRFYHLLSEVVRFQRVAQALLVADHDWDGPSLTDWLDQHHFSTTFRERLLLPQVAAVWSADPRDLSQFPARFLARFFANHGMLGLHHRPEWRTVTGGSSRYLAALEQAGLGHIRLNSPVTRVQRQANGVLVTTADHQREQFDQVIIASHADQALQLLDRPTAAEQAVLGAFRYQANHMTLHTDRGRLPQRRAAWASWNYHLADQAERVAVTYHMNRLQTLTAPVEFCVSLNQAELIDRQQILAERDYAHPVYTEATVLAQARHAEISGKDRIHYCGAYWGWGFHEDGVLSGQRVARALGGDELLGETPSHLPTQPYLKSLAS